MNLNMNDCCDDFAVHSYEWSVTPGHASSNSQYEICNVSRLNEAVILIFCIWVNIHRNSKSIQLFQVF